MRQFSEVTFVIAILTVIFMLTVYLLFKKRLSYLRYGLTKRFSHRQDFITLFVYFIPSLFSAIYTVKFLSDRLEFIDKLFDNLEYSYLLTVLVFIVIYFVLIGSLLEYYFYYTNENFEKWKNENVFKKKE